MILTSRRWTLTIALLAVAAYAPALSTGFLYDDHLLIESNPEIQSLTLAGVRHDFASGVFEHPAEGVNFYRPLQILSTRVEYALWKQHPLPYHLTNLILHIANALLVYQLIVALGIEALTAGLAACMFAVHPVIVEDLLMVSGRGELMGLFFSLAAILLLLQGGYRSLAWGLSAYGLALLSKESALITPALMAAVLYAQKRRPACYTLLLPMALLSGFYWVLRRHVLGPMRLPLAALHPLRFGVMAFPSVLWRYARILLVPFDLHTDRLLPHADPLWPLALAAVLVLGAAIFRWGPRWMRFCFLWYVLCFLPKAVLMLSGSFMSDHWAYPALPAVMLPLAVLGVRYLASPRQSVRRIAGIVLAGLVAAEIGTVYYNITTRNTDEKLYRSALQYTSSPTMQYDLAMVLLRRHRAEEALPYFQAVAAADPMDANAVRALAVGYWETGRRRAAIDTLNALQDRIPDDPITLQMLRGMRQTR